jgi:2-polyprenyl-3-methyl-5-hydroxy-6-metoxy-1,4-benzoquinol methylase
MQYIKEYTQLNAKEHRQLFYKRLFKSDKPGWDDTMVKLRDLVHDIMPEKACILDAGCGHGNFVVDELRSRISNVIGVDVGHETTTGNVSADKIIYSGLEDLPFEDNYFDGVVSLWVLEHLEKPEKVFLEIARVLKPGGFFAFATPNRDCYLIKIRQLMHAGLASYLVDKLYGRKDDDQFAVKYLANTTKKIHELSNDANFAVHLLATNADPPYTSFDRLTYKISAKFASNRCSFFHPHIIGIVQKPT